MLFSKFQKVDNRELEKFLSGDRESFENQLVVLVSLVSFQPFGEDVIGTFASERDDILMLQLDEPMTIPEVELQELQLVSDEIVDGAVVFQLSQDECKVQTMKFDSLQIYEERMKKIFVEWTRKDLKLDFSAEHRQVAEFMECVMKLANITNQAIDKTQSQKITLYADWWNQGEIESQQITISGSSIKDASKRLIDQLGPEIIVNEAEDKIMSKKKDADEYIETSMIKGNFKHKEFQFLLMALMGRRNGFVSSEDCDEYLKTAERNNPRDFPVVKHALNQALGAEDKDSFITSEPSRGYFVRTSFSILWIRKEQQIEDSELGKIFIWFSS